MPHKILFSLVLLTIICTTSPAWAAGECEDDPDACAGPRSWVLDFSEELEFDVDGIGVGTGEGWQRRGGTSPEPFYEDGKAIFDGSIAAWTLIDTIDHYFEGETTVHVKMDAHPLGDPDFEPDNGAGWWLNADNDGTEGGFYAIFGTLRRDEFGDPEYFFGPDGTVDPSEQFIPVAEGPIDVMVTLTPNAEDEEMLVSYSIMDVNETHTGEFPIPPRSGAGTPINDKWFTLFSNGSGQGIFDYVEVHNQTSTACDPSSGGDLDGNGTVEFADFLILSGNFGNAVTSHTEGDIDCNGTVEFADFLVLSGNFGKSPAGAESVPEPSCLALAMFGLCALSIRRRKRV